MAFFLLNGVPNLVKEEWSFVQAAGRRGQRRGYCIRKPDGMAWDYFKKDVLDTVTEANPKASLAFLFSSECNGTNVEGSWVHFYGTDVDVSSLEDKKFDVQPIPDQLPVCESFDHA
ncbi:MAG TPA: hypothetical protein DEA55_11940 [Rhodospirillaceae bacterium]|nr:hypothetical protein [Rhodospirillaceae bacterium]